MKDMTIGDIMTFVKWRREQKRCVCGDIVSIRHNVGTYSWYCSNCDISGLGFTSRNEAINAIPR